MFLSRLIRKLARQKKMEIPLELLSRLWVENKMPGGPVSEDQVLHQWAHEEIRRFYGQYVVPYFGVLGPAKPVIDQILTLLDEHGDCTPCCDDSAEERAFSIISLREHSLQVARIAVDMIKKAHRDYEMIAGKILIICLGHGLGVWSTAEVIGGKTLFILDPIIDDLPYKQEIITAIRTFSDNHPRIDEAKMLKAACFAVRKNEIERASVLSEMRRPASIDIQKIRDSVLPFKDRL